MFPGALLRPLGDRELCLGLYLPPGVRERDLGAALDPLGDREYLLVVPPGERDHLRVPPGDRERLPLALRNRGEERAL